MVQCCSLVKIFIVVHGPDQWHFIHDKYNCSIDSWYTVVSASIIDSFHHFARVRYINPFKLYEDESRSNYNLLSRFMKNPNVFFCSAAVHVIRSYIRRFHSGFIITITALRIFHLLDEAKTDFN